MLHLLTHQGVVNFLCTFSFPLFPKSIPFKLTFMMYCQDTRRWPTSGQWLRNTIEGTGVVTCIHHTPVLLPGPVGSPTFSSPPPPPHRPIGRVKPDTSGGIVRHLHHKKNAVGWTDYPFHWAHLLVESARPLTTPHPTPLPLTPPLTPAANQNYRRLSHIATQKLLNPGYLWVWHWGRRYQFSTVNVPDLATPHGKIHEINTWMSHSVWLSFIGHLCHVKERSSEHGGVLNMCSHTPPTHKSL